MNINCHLNHKNSPTKSKQDGKGKDQHSKSTSSMEEGKFSCPKCSESAVLMCYGCCLSISCTKCHDYAHFTSCKREFNKFSFPLDNLGTNLDLKSKKNKKIESSIQKCKRCESNCQELQYCQTCKTSICLKCSSQIHSKGKFTNHVRVLTSQFEKRNKRMETMVTEMNEPEQCMMRKSKRQNIENNEYGIKGKHKNKVPSTPNCNKRQKSVSRSQQNQQNLVTSLKRNKKSQNVSIIEAAQTGPSIQKTTQFQWLNCKGHNKMRAILTQTYDLICQSCYDQMKPNIQKKKVIDIESIVRSKSSSEQIKENIKEIMTQLNMKIQQLGQEFKGYKQQLSRQYHKNLEMLEQKYKQSHFNLQKWQKSYKQNLQDIVNQYQSINLYDQLSIMANKSQSHKQLSDILSLKIMLSFEQAHKMKKDYYHQLEVYQFKVNFIKTQEFQDLLKNFNFARRKLQNQSYNTAQKSLSKISQSNSLKQSRVSNVSNVSDRKNLKREESLQKSVYYELSTNNNLMKRSISKEIRQDISQKILFPNNGVKSDKKQMIKKIQSKNQTIRNSQYFFDNFNDDRNRKPNSKKQIIEIPNIAFKEVKYIELQNFMTEKMGKQTPKESESSYHQLSQKTFDNDESIDKSMRNIKGIQGKLEQQLKDSRIMYSINISNTQLNEISQKNAQNLVNSVVNISSVNTSGSNKTKRKSDYMQMRDRLRKPNYLNKLK